MIYSIATSEERWKLVKSESFFVVPRSRSIFCLVGVPTLGSIRQTCIPVYLAITINQVRFWQPLIWNPKSAAKIQDVLFSEVPQVFSMVSTFIGLSAVIQESYHPVWDGHVWTFYELQWPAFRSSSVRTHPVSFIFHISTPTFGRSLHDPAACHLAYTACPFKTFRLWTLFWIHHPWIPPQTPAPHCNWKLPGREPNRLAWMKAKPEVRVCWFGFTPWAKMLKYELSVYLPQTGTST